MNIKKIIVCLLSAVFVASCGCGYIITSTSFTSVSHSESPHNEPVNKETIDKYKDEHEYAPLSFIDFPEFPESEWNTDLVFNLSSDGSYYIVKDVLGSERHLNQPTLVIPAYYNGKPVKEIAQAKDEVGSFSELDWLKKVYLPPTIERIAYGTFSLSAVEELYIDCENLEDFEGRNWVFYPSRLPNYKGMDVYFGPHVKKIPERLFFPNSTEPHEVPIIKNVYFDKECKVESIGSHAFHSWMKIDSLSLPSTVKTIGDFAFYAMDINELTLPESLEYIGKNAFAFSSLEYVKANSKLAAIKEGAFSYSKLDGIDLSNTSITVIEDGLFAHSKIKCISLPNGLTSIGVRAFLDNEIVNLIIPDSVKKISRSAFSYSPKLEKLYLGYYLEVIDDEAFLDVPSLSYVEISSIQIEKVGINVFRNMGKNKPALIYANDGVRLIPAGIFYTSDENKANKIDTVHIPGSIYLIEKNAFLGIEVKRLDYALIRSKFESVRIESGNVFLTITYGGIY